MPTYPYLCESCELPFDVIKSVSQIDRKEPCPDCGTEETYRYIDRTHFYGASDWDNAEYSPAFGKIIKNAKHRKEEAKRRGLVEIGNEPVEKLHKEADKRAQETIDEAWSKV